MNLEELRKTLHQHPEVSGKEKQTSVFIVKKLKEIGVTQVHENFSEYSLLAEIDFNSPGKTILFRAELDALPIEETNQFTYQSKNKNVSHKCGHDGHMTMLLGLAEKLIEHRNEFSGKVLLLFQSSEETGKGAKNILKSKILEKFNIDYAFSLHNVPGYPLGNIITKPQTFTPSVESVDIELLGKTSHAGMPWKGINPASAIRDLINYFTSIHQPDVTQENYFLATPIYIQMGEKAYGTSAGKATLSYTLRTGEHKKFVQQKKEIIHQIEKTCQRENLNFSLQWKEAFEANNNDPEAFELIRKAAEANQYSFTEKEHFFNWGEDFGAFTQQYKGAMFGLGSGENTPELHNPDYDFPDQLLPYGINMFYSLSKKLLQ
ncbi:putative hydrolase YxeP [Mesonia oceanica]|uniref:Hydrolase YxeP n=2 Tax=Flavobacteriaceae TaxID=49546 RepID=A0AC61YAD7_9FLAO|nr:putative hydrolase YxeP [Mesonia oceanica]